MDFKKNPCLNHDFIVSNSFTQATPISFKVYKHHKDFHLGYFLEGAKKKDEFEYNIVGSQ